MIAKTEIDRWIRQAPGAFRPFRVVLSDGDAITIHEFGMTVSSQSDVMFNINGVGRRVPLARIDRIEAAPLTPAS